MKKRSVSGFAPLIAAAVKKRLAVSSPDARLRLFRAAVFAGAVFLALRLFVLQVLSREFYSALASNQHDLFEQLFPERGTIYVRDPTSSDGVFPVAVNKKSWRIFADMREVGDPADAARKLAPILELDETELAEKFSRKDDPYVPLKKGLTDDMVERARALGIRGINLSAEAARFYPENSMLSHVVGFVGSTETGEKVGRYGIEGRWNRELYGEAGFLESERDPFGRLIGSAARRLRRAEDGADMILTIDRTIQYTICRKLRAAVAKYGAAGGTVVVMNPKTGAVLGMCSAPDFNPNEYSGVPDMKVFNNPAIFAPYEPGSIFKTITFAAALDAGKLTPATTFNDEGVVPIGQYNIRNSDGKANGLQTMTQVLEKSLNTGTIFAARRLGAEAFKFYVEGFGFGKPTGIELGTEAGGTVASLDNKGDIWIATASYGQGISATPLQMTAAYAAVANGGKLMRPYVIDTIKKSAGAEIRTQPVVVRQVITKRAASLISGMLASVVENGHGKRAAVRGYYVAGKTGTAQIARQDGRGYEKDATIGSFVGFAPVDDPAFVMLVKIDRPRDVQWAESSAAPLFGEIAKFLLNYMQIPPERL